MPHDRGVRPLQVRTEEHDGHLVVAMSGDLGIESAGIVIAALDRAGEAVQPEIVLDLRDLSFIARGEIRAPVTAEALAGVRGGPASIAGAREPVPATQDPGGVPGRRRRRRLPARCRSSRGWTTPEA